MPQASNSLSIGNHLFANSLKPVSTKPAGLCGHGYIVCQSNAPLNVACAFNPKFCEALAAYFNCCTAHSCLVLLLPCIDAGAKPSNCASYAGCTATNCPCKCCLLYTSDAADERSSL